MAIQLHRNNLPQFNAISHPGQTRFATPGIRKIGGAKLFPVPLVKK